MSSYNLIVNAHDKIEVVGFLDYYGCWEGREAPYIQFLSLLAWTLSTLIYIVLVVEFLP